MSTTIYIITHKKVELPTIEGFEPLLVGANNHSEITCYRNKDNTGDNISDKNSRYCELTGVYWIWKNSKADITGICHYRRFFIKTIISTKTKYFLNNKDISSLFERYEVIVPKAWHYKKNILDSVQVAPNRKDLGEIETAIKKVSPEYLGAYLGFLEGKKSYLYNMCIMRKKMFDKYCEWLFPILEYIEERHDFTGEDAYRTRLLGFLSERLIAVWLKVNVEPSKIKECRVVKTDESTVRSLGHQIKDYYRRICGRVIC